MTNNQNSKSPAMGTTPSNGKPTRFSSTSGGTQKRSSNTGKPARSQSRFAQKSRSKPHTKPVSKPRGPVNAYTSVCCSLPASKPGCVKVDKKKALEQGLGSWHCSGCRKACKVTVSKFHVAEVTVGDVTVTAAVPVLSELTSLGVPLAG